MASSSVTSNPDNGSPSGAAAPLATSAFDYHLPAHLIASRPAAERDASRLLVVRRDSDGFEHRLFRDVVELVSPGDVVVFNETRVFPARLLGRRPGGGEAEIVLLNPLALRAGRDRKHEQERSGEMEGQRPLDDADAFGDADWAALVRPGSKLKPGRRVVVGGDLEVEIVAILDDGLRHVRLHSPLPVREAIEQYGHIPLPPYIDRADDATDRERYQTVFGTREGSVAAPTAGLHFTPAVLAALRERGVEIATVLLHVGVGTFRPVEVEDPAQHVMHAEWYEVSESQAAVMNRVRTAGGRLWAVGTTVARTLESAVDRDVARGSGDVAPIVPGTGWTRLFIRPGFDFSAVDRLITNFHLPRSTLLMLVSAFAGHERAMQAYAEAVREQYRFYSYGDAMVIL
ncbi:MAG TPA: tRNA preQ1(34) S-adenosylmethionine ribosyltransferase-isomerase QueA [Longimicrobiales bacterium]|nr:tRNA preQ1(34) S-adenosylmethionine ribosyltransferase-isomerase QueA [Longimicrobiales bacterium]